MHENATIRKSAVAWIRALESNGWPASKNREWPYFEYSQFLEVLIRTYQADANAETKTEIARMLAIYPCVRVSRFMRAAVHSPSARVRTIARKYLGGLYTSGKIRLHPLPLGPRSPAPGFEAAPARPRARQGCEGQHCLMHQHQK